jgi:tetratricopeptide (TPR) repeat protein
MLVGRNRLAAGAFAALVILIVAFGIVSITQALRIRAERDRANQQAAMANEVSEFLVNLYRETNPVEVGGVLTAKDLLLSGRKRLEKELRDKPEIRARLLMNIGSALSVVGPVEEAISAYRESIQIYGADSGKAADAWSGLAITYYNLGRYEEAVEASRQSIRLLRSTGKANPALAGQLHDLGVSLAALGKHEDALRSFEEAEQLDREFGRGPEEATAVRLASHGSLLRRMGRYDEAIEKLTAAAQLLQNPERRTNLLRTWNDLGTTLNNAGRHAEGEKYLRMAMTEAAKLFGETHPNLGIVRLNLGFSLTGQKRWEDANRILLEAQKLLAGSLPRLHPSQRDLLRLEAEIAEGKLNYAAAVQVLTEAHQLAIEAGQKEHPQTQRLEILKLRNLARMGQTQAALPRLEEIMAGLKKDSEDYRLAQESLVAARQTTR